MLLLTFSNRKRHVSITVICYQEGRVYLFDTLYFLIAEQIA